MKLNELILRRPLFVAFGTSQQTGGLTSVDLEATRDGSQVLISASDGSVAPVPAADASTAGVMSGADKAALEALPPTTTREFAVRAEIAQATVSAAITHLRSAGYAGAADGGGAVYKRADSEPGHALKVQSADGAWWELVPDQTGINVRQAGAVGDGVTDDGQAFLDALAGVEDFNSDGTTVAVHTVIVPPGDYNLASTTLELKKVVRLVGHGGRGATVKASSLRWDANVTGIIVHRENTLGATVEVTPTGGASGSSIEGLHLIGGEGSRDNVIDGTKGHGIWLRASATMRDLTIEHFAGNGVNIVATAGGANDIEGNANVWFAENIRIIECHQHGFFVDGADVNAAAANHLDVVSNGRWGVFDSSFLGNSYTACHSAGNGNATVGGNAAGEGSFVSFGGRRYSANVNATEADLVATEPGTNEAVWIDTASGTENSRIPLWQAGQLAGTYFHGGGYRTDNSNAHNWFVGPYSEMNEGRPQLVHPTVWFAGEGFEPSGGYGGLAGTSASTKMLGSVRFENQQAFAPDRDLTLVLNSQKDSLWEMLADGDHPRGWAFAWDETTGQWMLQHSALDGLTPLRLTTNLNTETYSRASALGGGEITFERGVWLGSNSLRTRWIGQSVGPPSSGEHARGDMVFNATPSVQTDTDGVDWIILGWKAVTNGSPGTWQPLWTRVSNPPGL